MFEQLYLVQNAKVGFVFDWRGCVRDVFGWKLASQTGHVFVVLELEHERHFDVMATTGVVSDANGIPFR